MPPTQRQQPVAALSDDILKRMYPFVVRRARVWVQRMCAMDERVHAYVCAQVRREVYALDSPDTVHACGAIAVGPPNPFSFHLIS